MRKEKDGEVVVNWANVCNDERNIEKVGELLGKCGGVAGGKGEQPDEGMGGIGVGRNDLDVEVIIG